MDELLAKAPCGFLSFVDDGRVLLVNSTLLEMLGFESDELTGRHIDVIFPPGVRVFYQTHFFPLLRLHGSAEEIYLSLRGTDGREIPILANAVRRERNGMWVNDCVFMRMSQRSRFEDEILEARREAERANKAKDEFLAALSHELRTPLAPVLMTAIDLESDPELSDDLREQIAMIRRNVELEARLIDDLLDITRITHGKLRLQRVDLDVHLVLGHTAEIVQDETNAKQINLQFSLEAVSHHVSGDPTRLHQVFWNLVKNAVKFTPPGGQIRVITSNPAPERIAVQVCDSGLGIEPEALPRIFNAFQQGSVGGQPRFGGLGLGLAISKAIVEMHGGTISVESQGLSHGASFTVELAAIAKAEKPATLASSAGS